MEIDIEKVLNFIRDNAEKYAQAKANRIYVEEFKSSLLARLMQASQMNGVSSAAGQERDSKSSVEYTDHLKAISEAVQAEESLKCMLIAAQAKIEVWRTIKASERVEARNI